MFLRLANKRELAERAPLSPRIEEGQKKSRPGLSKAADSEPGSFLPTSRFDTIARPCRSSLNS